MPPFLLFEFKPVASGRFLITTTRGWHSVSSGSPHVKGLIRQRVHYPGTYCYSDPYGNIRMGYGVERPSIRDEYLKIELRQDGRCRIERDMYCTLPLFYGYTSDGTLVVSNEYAEVVKRLPQVTLNYRHLGQILGNDTMRSETLWKEVRILGERQVLHMDRDGLRLETPLPRQWSYCSELLRIVAYQPTPLCSCARKRNR